MADSRAVGFPKYYDLIYPILKAVDALGGSAEAREITNQVAEDLGFTEEELAITYERQERPKSILVDRIVWARSTCKSLGMLESPKRSVFLLTPVGKNILTMPDAIAQEHLLEMNRQIRAERRKNPKRLAAGATPPVLDDDGPAQVGEEDDEWKDELLGRLHRLTPDGFEEFVLYLLRTYGLELTRMGGSGDEGIDGIGLAPISDVLSSRVAVQVKRYDPKGPALGREVVALFQRDASAAGAERAVLVTLGRFSAPARKAAIVARPTVDLIDGTRLCDLVEKRRFGSDGGVGG